MCYKNLLSCVLLFIMMLLSCCSNDQERLTHAISALDAEMAIEIAQSEDGIIHSRKILNLENDTIEFKTGHIAISSQIIPDPDVPGAYNIELNSTVVQGSISGYSMGVQFKFNNWNDTNFVLMPGAVYKGNRFRSMKKIRGVPTYEALKINPGNGPLITNVPRLSINKSEESLLQQLSGDMSTPGVGIQFTNKEKCLFFLTPQNENNASDYSYKIWENKGHSQGQLTIRIPGIREDSVFKGGGRDFSPSLDEGITLNAGEHLTFRGKVFILPSENTTTLFDHFVKIRKTFGSDTIPPEIPFSAAWQIMEHKYNTQNWVDQYGYYSVGMRESRYQDWQTGWVGGMNTAYPLLALGNQDTYHRALQTFDFLFDTISPVGLFYEVFHNGQWYLKDDASFLRRNSDALYFILKSFKLIEVKQPDFNIPDKWKNAAEGAANFYVELWNTYGEFGQQAEFKTGKLVASGTSSNGIACAALTLCSEYFNNDSYLDVAQKAAEQYYNEFVMEGYTTGGPGDIYQGIDSESAFGLLEAFVILYEHTRETKWLVYAEDMANQCASWVVSYNYQFPETSTFNKMDMKTTGTVIANVQNKHSAPGICTLSGNSLLKLYRYTGNEFYIDLLTDIARTLSQYMSRADRPIPDIRPDVRWPVMPPGWINERVNLSDWEERGNPGDIKRGELFGGSTWSEAAFLNSMADIPGIYVYKEDEKIWVIDHIEANIIDNQLIIHNPTQYPAKVSIMIETVSEQASVLNSNYNLNFRTVMVKPQETETLVLN